MKIIVGNIIRIIDAEPIIEKYCKSNLEIDNPQYAQNERLGFPTYNIPRRLYWYEKHGNSFDEDKIIDIVNRATLSEITNPYYTQQNL